ncbi:L-ribulose-5-phosphate 4-epimerase [Tepidanaerobacter syntrophicus]|uniref:L-ribulose-5-phosphate 4-epimerase n=1 Tax=Tepidanaerobacter syntrophicus TaxID=224999 RepID=UPI001BD3CDA1|nr:L-ribulose-5-phosphate 4-epimerase [Tepidanaerobacter syntrophicus]
MLEQLKSVVYKANMELPKHKLVTFTWGNVSGIDRERGLVVIKPSGVNYEKLKPEDMVVVDLEGKKIEGNYKPSTDTPTHLALYNKFIEIGGVVHTHSPWATSFAQAKRDIVAYGTTHSDYFYGNIPCTRAMTDEEIIGDYEYNTGIIIAETFKDKNPMDVPAALVANHGPFAWGKDPMEAVHNAAVLEQVAMMAYYTEAIEHIWSSNTTQAHPIPQKLADKHYYRKHGPDAYYGQIN